MSKLTDLIGAPLRGEASNKPGLTVATPASPTQTKPDDIKTSVPAAPVPETTALESANKQLLSMEEITLLENQNAPAEFNNPEQPVSVNDQTSGFQQAIAFMHRALQQEFDTETCNKSIAQVNSMLKQTPALQELLLPEDVGAMVKLLERNYGTLVYQKQEAAKTGTRAKRAPRQTKRSAAQAAAQEDVASIAEALGGLTL